MGDISDLERDQLEALCRLQANEILRLKETVAVLVEDSNFLAALEAAGVDNWEGYDEAKEIYSETE